MIKIKTESNTEFIINQEQKQIKRLPRTGTEFESILSGFTNVGEWQPYTHLAGLAIGDSLFVDYPNEQNWSWSTPIKEIDYGYKEESND